MEKFTKDEALVVREALYDYFSKENSLEAVQYYRIILTKVKDFTEENDISQTEQSS